MSHTLRSLDAEWRRLTRTSRARRALKQWSIAHPALRGLAGCSHPMNENRRRQLHRYPDSRPFGGSSDHARGSSRTGTCGRVSWRRTRCPRTSSP
jgi:hypothetical protein